jgi:hypothetical protein
MTQTKRATLWIALLAILLLALVAWLNRGIQTTAPAPSTAVRSTPSETPARECVSDAGHRYSQGALIRNKNDAVLRCEDGKWVPATAN